MKKSMILGIEVIGIAILIILDRLSKMWATATLMGQSGIELIPGALKFYYLPNGNTGAAFGMLEGQLWLFVLITLLVTLVMFYFMIKVPFTKKYVVFHLIFVFIIAGGIGNLYDRIVYGSVVDFIYFYLINFPIFNVADCYVTVATVVLAVVLIFIFKEEDFKELEPLLSFKKKGTKESE